MKTRRNGFAEIIVLLISAALFFGGAYLYDASRSNQSLGASIQTQLTDTIGTFRTNVNTSLSTLDAAVESLTSTQAGYGNIVTQNTPLAVSVGGSGTTTIPANNTFAMGNGTGYSFRTLASSTGISLTFTPTTTIIGTAGFDSTANIAFSGSNTHSGTETFNATATFNATTTTFANFPNIPTSTPTGTQPISAFYAQNHFPLFIASTSGSFVGAGTSSITLVTSTFTLNNAGRILISLEGSDDETNGNFSLNGAYFCNVAPKIDGTQPSDFTTISSLVGVTISTHQAVNGNPSFSYISQSLSAGSHTVTLISNITGGTASPLCQISGTLQIEYLGQ